MWQSRVEIEHYSVMYFDRVSAFKVLNHRELLLKAGLIVLHELTNA